MNMRLSKNAVLVLFLLIHLSSFSSDIVAPKDVNYVMTWAKDHQQSFIANNPGISMFSIDVGKYAISISVKGTISNWGDLRLLLSSIKGYYLSIEYASDMSGLRYMKEDCVLYIGIEDDQNSLRYDNLSFLKKTKISSLITAKNVSLKSLLGIEDSNIKLLYIWNASEITDYYRLKGTDIEELRLVNATNLFDLKEISQMKKLEYLTIERSNITDLHDLTDNKSISYLYIDNCDIDNLTPIASMRNLKTLRIRDVPINDLRPLSLCPSLERIILSKTRVRDLSPLTNIHSLKTIHININADMAIPEALKKHIRYYK